MINLLLLSTAKSASVGFRPVLQLFAQPTNPANAPRAEYSCYKFGKKLLWVSTICAQILGFSRVRVRPELGFRLGLGLALGSV